MRKSRPVRCMRSGRPCFSHAVCIASATSATAPIWSAFSVAARAKAFASLNGPWPDTLGSVLCSSNAASSVRLARGRAESLMSLDCAAMSSGFCCSLMRSATLACCSSASLMPAPTLPSLR